LGLVRHRLLSHIAARASILRRDQAIADMII
jgi:hypothetical protein